MPEIIVVLICLWSLSYSLAPNIFPIRILAPIQSPFRNKINNVEIGLQIPTAAKA
jgi:hypothetical protein